MSMNSATRRRTSARGDVRASCSRGVLQSLDEVADDPADGVLGGVRAACG